MATKNLLTYYNFQDESQSQEQLLARWLQSYPARWVRLALIEALYQGRYKSISVELLLQLWQRRGQPIYHFNGEFETLVCHNVPQTFMSLNGASTEAQGLAVPQAAAPQLPNPEPSTSAPIERPATQLRPPAIEPSLPPAPEGQPQGDRTTVPSPPVLAEVTLLSPSKLQPLLVLSPPTSEEQSEQEFPETAVSVRERQQEQPLPAAPSEHISLAVDQKLAVDQVEAQDNRNPVDWLTADLEMTTVENVQALVTQHAQHTPAMTSPIHHFTPTVPATGLYMRLAAIANTQ